MNKIERRKIAELAAMYELEPQLRDVYVEGTFDKALVEWILYEGHARTAVVREIDSVDIPLVLAQKYGYPSNNRGRVMALARELETALAVKRNCATCLIDADFDHILGTRHALKMLLSTDYSSMELYFFDVRTLAKFLTLVVQGFPKSAESTLREIEKALSDLFAIRLALYNRNWKIPMISFERCCRLSHAGVQLDTKEYIVRLLNAGNRYGQRTEFAREFEECRKTLTGDPRHHIHGHDFLHILSWYVGQHKGQALSEAAMSRSMLACADSNALQKEHMFSQVLIRVV